MGQLHNADSDEERLKNYNNEFLIIFAKHMIASMPSDRTITANIATRALAAAACLGHAVFSTEASLKILVLEKCS